MVNKDVYVKICIYKSWRTYINGNLLTSAVYRCSSLRDRIWRLL